ncbi:MAG: deazaflavin-dependent nitroreductase, partial [Roseiflexaceae bacterium]
DGGRAALHRYGRRDRVGQERARAAGWALLTRGRKQERVAMIELPVEQRGPILREFPRQVPHGVQFFTLVLGLSNDPEAFAAAAPQCPVFRVNQQF